MLDIKAGFVLENVENKLDCTKPNQGNSPIQQRERQLINMYNQSYLVPEQLLTWKDIRHVQLADNHKLWQTLKKLSSTLQEAVFYRATQQHSTVCVGF